VALYGDTLFAFEFHVVQHLSLTLALGDGGGSFEQAVGEGAFTVVDVCYDAKVAYVFHLISCDFVCKVNYFWAFFKISIMGIVSKYASLVKFSHTVFAMPFALVGYVYALRSTDTPFEGLLLVKVLLCMVFARNAAMGFNRWADRHIDAENPRTAGREIPAGKVSPRAALWFIVVNVALFIAVAALINRLTLVLSPVALLVLLGYSYTKRFTAWSHIVLGMALGIAPVGAYIAATGTIAVAPVILAAAVLTWVAGFDIIYASADAAFDRTHGLHSVPARFSGRGAIAISIFLHAVTLYAVAVFGLFTSRGTVYWIGAGVFVALLILQHTSRRLAFDWVNGAASIAFAACAITDLLA
jgi:4-hydroxybenzoate polyprenyltransferase